MTHCRHHSLLAVFALMLCACGVSDKTAQSSSSTTEPPTGSASVTSIDVVPQADATPEAIPDIVLHGGSIFIADEASTVVEAIAIKDGTVLAVGSSEEMIELAGPSTTTVDLEQRSVLPGFIDPHTHLSQVPAPDLEAMASAHEQMVARGITTVGIPSVEPEHLDAYRELEASEQLLVRTHLYPVYNTVCGGYEHDDFHLDHQFDRDPNLGLAIAGVKIYTDGGVCNAPAVSFEYPDSVPQGLKESGWVGRGSLYVSPDEIAAVVAQIDDAGGITVIHGIGDVGLRTALEGLEIADTASPLSQPHRIDHNSMASLLDDDELSLYGQLDIIPVVQMMPWASGCEEGRSELWATILPAPAYSSVEDRSAIAEQNPGIRFAWHSDNPWVPGSPLQHLFSATTRGAITDDGSDVCFPEAWDWFPTVEVDEAIKMTTINAAAAMGIDQHVGSLEVGKAADLVVLSNNIFDTDPKVALAFNRSEITMISGTTVFCDSPLCDDLFGG